MLEYLRADVWVIAMTLKGWTQDYIYDLPEQDRIYWREKCVEYHDDQEDAAKGLESI